MLLQLRISCLSVLMMILMTEYSSAALCRSYRYLSGEIGPHVTVLESGTSCSASSGLLHYFWQITPNTRLYRQFEIQCSNHNHTGSWVVTQPRSNNASDGSAVYSIPRVLLNEESIISCVVRGCYNLKGDYVVDLTNSVTVNCPLPDVLAVSTTVRASPTTTLIASPTAHGHLVPATTTQVLLPSGLSPLSSDSVSSSLLPSVTPPSSTEDRSLMLTLLLPIVLPFLVVLPVFVLIVFITHTLYHNTSKDFRSALQFNTPNELDFTAMPLSPQTKPHANSVSRGTVYDPLDIDRSCDVFHTVLPNAPSCPSLSCSSELIESSQHPISEIKSTHRSSIRKDDEEFQPFEFEETAGNDAGLRRAEETAGNDAGLRRAGNTAEEESRDEEGEAGLVSCDWPLESIQNRGDLPSRHVQPCDALASPGANSSQFDCIESQTSSDYVANGSGFPFLSSSNTTGGTSLSEIQSTFPETSAHTLQLDDIQMFSCFDESILPDNTDPDRRTSLATYPTQTFTTYSSAQNSGVNFGKPTKASNRLFGISNPLFERASSLETIETEDSELARFKEDEVSKKIRSAESSGGAQWLIPPVGSGLKRDARSRSRSPLHHCRTPNTSENQEREGEREREGESEGEGERGREGEGESEGEREREGEGEGEREREGEREEGEMLPSGIDWVSISIAGCAHDSETRYDGLSSSTGTSMTSCEACSDGYFRIGLRAEH